MRRRTLPDPHDRLWREHSTFRINGIRDPAWRDAAIWDSTRLCIDGGMTGVAGCWECSGGISWEPCRLCHGTGLLLEVLPGLGSTRVAL